MSPLLDRVIFVTGAARGIGRACAFAYHASGTRVVIADAAVFLLSDAARFITGCILPVSGGAELGYRR